MTTKELEGIAHELGFWQRFVKEDRFIEGWVPTDRPTPELHRVARDTMGKLKMGHIGPYEDIDKAVLTDRRPFKVLDVGSGVTSLLNGFISKEDLTATDPLAGLYKLIFDYERFSLVPPTTVPAEELTRHGFANKFDLVHCSNALDHTQKPSYVLEEMMDCCRPGGRVIIQGFENEGQYERYAGFHQWNIVMDLPGSLKIGIDPNLTYTEFEGDPQFCHLLPIPSQKRNWYIWTSLPK